MNVSSMVASGYAVKNASAVGNFYASVATSGASATTQSAMAIGTPDTVVTFSKKALELMRLRQVNEKDTQQFEDILSKANSANAQANPQAFLSNLSASDMEVLRKVHSLANPIDVSSLTSEGAANLLVQPGSAEDLDNNGLTSIGAANMLQFPPRNAPESFKAAWASATEGKSFADIPTQMIFAVGLANIGREPGDPNWRNPYADPNYDYKAAVSDIMSSLKYEFAHSMIPEKQFLHDMNFYDSLSKAMTQA